MKRSPDPSDGRGSRVSLTEQGVQSQERVLDAFLAATRDLLAPVSKSELAQTDRALQRLLETLEEALSR